MIRKETETRKIEVITDIICNKCGSSCNGLEYESLEFATLQVHWGYGSKNHDGEVHEAHLCENCWENLVKEFKYSDLVAENQF